MNQKDFRPISDFLALLIDEYKNEMNFRITLSEYHTFVEHLSRLKMLQFSPTWIKSYLNIKAYLSKRLAFFFYESQYSAEYREEFVQIFDRLFLFFSLDEGVYKQISKLDSRNNYSLDSYSGELTTIIQFHLDKAKKFVQLYKSLHKKCSHSYDIADIDQLKSENDQLFQLIKQYQSYGVPDLYAEHSYSLSMFPDRCSKILYYDPSILNENELSVGMYKVLDNLPLEIYGDRTLPVEIFINVTTDSQEITEDTRLKANIEDGRIKRMQVHQTLEWDMHLLSNGNLYVGFSRIPLKNIFHGVHPKRGSFLYEFFRSMVLVDFANLVVPSYGIDYQENQPKLLVSAHRMSVEDVSRKVLLPMIKQLRDRESNPQGTVLYQEGSYVDENGVTVSVRLHRRRLTRGQYAGSQAIALAKKLGWTLDPSKETLVKAHERSIKSTSSNTAKQGIYRTII